MTEKQNEVIERYKERFPKASLTNGDDERIEFLLSEISLSNKELIEAVLGVIFDQNFDCNKVATSVKELTGKVKKLAEDRGITLE